MFSQACVIHSVHGGGVGVGGASQHAIGQGGVHPPGHTPPAEMAIEAGGTHPTGKHSWFTFF